ncbi:tyrosinase family oxidase copper chaperone [Streptomyces sp. NPDC049813]|uniref:tyrosinase family oxidase copper chaperone n=1 Tax=Streptomyces sp. NPDC049813 TaxID=3365597 RepID=UPI0037B1F1C5
MSPEMLLSRRGAALALLGAATTTVAVLRLRSPAAPDPQPRAQAGPGTAAFDETYLGRRITGVLLPAAAPGEEDVWQVTVDGRPLHLMRRADGTYLSMVDHYDAYPGPLAAARGAVVELGGQTLRAHEGRPVPLRDRKA